MREKGKKELIYTRWLCRTKWSNIRFSCSIYLRYFIISLLNYSTFIPLYVCVYRQQNRRYIMYCCLLKEVGWLMQGWERRGEGGWRRGGGGGEGRRVCPINNDNLYAYNFAFINCILLDYTACVYTDTPFTVWCMHVLITCRRERKTLLGGNRCSSCDSYVSPTCVCCYTLYYTDPRSLRK